MKDANSSTQNETYKLLYEENQKKERNDKIDKLKEGYAKFENGGMSKDDFRDWISREVQVTNTEKIDKILSQSQLDGKGFSEILSSLDILKKRPIEEKKNPNYDPKYMKWKRVLPTPKSLETETDWNYLLKQYSRQFVSRNMNGGEFRELLQKYGVNSNADAINKYIRATEAGKNVKLSDMLCAILQHKDDKLDPTKINYDKGHNAFLESKDGRNKDRSMIPVTKGQSQLMPFTKKKILHPPLNSLNSQKDAFDWDAHALNKIKANLANDGNVSKQTPLQKHVFESHVFDDMPIMNKKQSKKAKLLAEKTDFKGTGDIFTWKGVEDKKLSDCGGKAKSVKRRNPNETIHEEKAERKITKLNKMLKSSSENALNRKK